MSTNQGAFRPAGIAGSAIALALSFALALVLGGCGSQPDPTAPTPGASGGGKPSAPQAEMVAAFSANRAAGGLVDLRFSIAQRPKVGEPTEIELSLTPSVELERLFARFQVAEGLQLVSGAETGHLEHTPAGVPVGHKLTVMAKADGIYYVTAIVLADSDKESVARTFAIPLIAGQGLTELPATPPAASVVNTRQASARP